MTAIAIDFGTSRIKVAYLGKGDGKPKLWHLGQHERPWMPSLVYLGKDGTRLFCDAAEAMLHSDPDGVVCRLKRRLREPRIRVNGQSASPCELLSSLFANLRCRAGEEIRDFDGKAPSEVFLTVPSLMVQERSLYQKAASDAGFVNAEFVPEPIAAAQAWLAEAQEHDSEVLVLDCGGGTIDWAALRKVNDRFDFMPECPPGGDGHLGGEDVDDSILALIEDAVPSTEFERDLKQWEAQARLAKEHFSNTRQSFVARVAGHSVTLLPDAMSQLANDALVEKASAQFLKYAALARNHLRTKRPLVLLVGGTSKIAGLKERLAREDSLRVVWWEKSEFATVRGALSFPISPNPVQNNEPKHMLEIGLHWLHGIGVPHDSERAVVWIKKAADAGYLDAQYVIAKLYLDGHGVEKNSQKAIEYLQNASGNGHALSQLLLGLCYETGVGVPGNLYQAAALYQQAAEKGIAEAQQLLGRCYEEGRGVFKDSEMAQYWQSKFSLNKGGLLRD